MSLTQKLAHNTIAQMTGKIISTPLGLIAIGMLTRYLGTEQFGWYITAITFLQFVGILIDFGLIPVTAQMMSEPHFDKQQLYKNLLAYRFVTALLFLGLAPLALFFFPYPTPVKIAISFLTISFLSIAINQVLVGLYQVKMKMHIQAIGEVVGRIVLVGGLYVFIRHGAGFLPLMGVVTAGSVAYTLTLWIRARKETSLGFAFDTHIWRAITIKMWPLALGVIFNVVYLKGDLLLLTIMREQTEVGIYGAAYRVIDILSQVAMMIMGLMLPLLAYSWSRNKQTDFSHRLQLSFDTMMLLSVPMVVGTAMLATPIMRIIGGDEFVASGRPLQILSLAVLGVFIGTIFGHTAVAINKQKQTLWIYISNAVITFTGYLIFIPIYGMYGAAWMTVFSEMYTGLLLFGTIYYYVRQRIQLLSFVKIVISSLVMAVVIYYMHAYSIFIIIPAAILTYGVMLLITRAVSQETIREILVLKK
jgi:O-antigen/teichoic acid export membrane protein